MWLVKAKLIFCKAYNDAMNDYDLDKMDKKQILHKMKSPLTSINGYADMIGVKLKIDPNDPKLLDWSKHIKKEVKVLVAMIEKVEKLSDS